MTTHPLEPNHETLNQMGILSFAEAETAMVGRGCGFFRTDGRPGRQEEAMIALVTRYLLLVGVLRALSQACGDWEMVGG